MTDPKRWIEDGAPDAVRDLLVAAREEQPSRTASRRALVALGLGGALSAGAKNAAGATGNVLGSIPAAKGAATLGFAVKWGLVGGATAAVVGLAGVALRQGSLPAGSPVAPARESAAHVVPRAAQPDNGPTAHAEPEAPPPAAVQAASEPGSDSARDPRASLPAPATTAEHAPRDVAAREATSVLLEEVAAIDQARAAVARGDAAAAIAALNDYTARFKSRRFEPEALYLRMEALGAAGDSEGQRRVAERLLAAFPNAPQAARASALLR